MYLPAKGMFQKDTNPNFLLQGNQGALYATTSSPEKYKQEKSA